MNLRFCNARQMYDILTQRARHSILHYIDTQPDFLKMAASLCTKRASACSGYASGASRAGGTIARISTSAAALVAALLLHREIASTNAPRATMAAALPAVTPTMSSTGALLLPSNGGDAEGDGVDGAHSGRVGDGDGAFVTSILYGGRVGDGDGDISTVGDTNGGGGEGDANGGGGEGDANGGGGEGDANGGGGLLNC